jgi:hypothetical protein
MSARRLIFAEGCAWRAFYLRTASGWQYLHAGIDPQSSRIILFAGLALRVRGRVHALHCRFPILTARFRTSRIGLTWYRLVAGIAHRLDGRRRQA